MTTTIFIPDRENERILRLTDRENERISPAKQSWLGKSCRYMLVYHSTLGFGGQKQVNFLLETTFLEHSFCVAVPICQTLHIGKNGLVKNATRDQADIEHGLHG